MNLTKPFVGAVLLAACWLLADPAPSVQQKKGDPQNEFEPRSSPGKGQKFLQQFVGDWVVDKTFFSATGAPSKTKGECRQFMTQGGHFLQSDFTFGEGKSKTTGSGLIGYEPDSGLFTSVWIDSRQTKMSLRQSKDPFGGEEIVLFGGSLKEGAKATRISRTNTRVENNASNIVHKQYSVVQDGKQRLIMELLMTRKNKGP